MPELPEVETVCRYLRPHLLGVTVQEIIVRQASLRYRVRPNISQLLKEKRILGIERRAKYILLRFSHGTLLIHLGMSGNLYLMQKDSPIKKHDHIDIVLKKNVVRFNDPRRFGCFVWEGGQEKKSLLAGLGYEPLEDGFNGTSLYKITRKTKLAIKTLLMTGRYISGIGNIYATEALWSARLSPFLPADQLSQEECRRLAAAVKKILTQAIEAGGTRIRDYRGADGKGGYFHINLNVYGRGGEACPTCRTRLQKTIQNQRASFFCPQCQCLKNT